MSPGRFVDEMYVEDDDEAERLAMEEGMRSSRMLGCVLLGLVVLIFTIAAWILLTPHPVR